MTNIFAHRGASGDCPENTMPAFKKAIEDGADGIELDVQMTKDGRIVVIHDETLDRTTSLKGFVKDTAYDKIRTADAAGKWKDAFKGVRIPLLSDVLRFAERADFLINIELKNSVFRYEGMEEEVIKKVRYYGLEKRVIFSSFNHESLAVCHVSGSKERNDPVHPGKCRTFWPQCFRGQPYAPGRTHRSARHEPLNPETPRPPSSHPSGRPEWRTECCSCFPFRLQSARPHLSPGSFDHRW